MNKNSTKKILEDLLEHAGVHINGKEAYDIQIHDEHMLDRIIHEQTLGLGETYMDKAWDVQALDEFFPDFSVRTTNYSSWIIEKPFSICNVS